jgi:antitoxin ParD1/3/4
MAVKSSILLTYDQYAFAKRLVESRRFRSLSAVLQQGIELVREKMEHEAVERDALAQILGDRRSGPFLPATKLDSRLSRMIAKKRRAHPARDRISADPECAL